VYFAIGPSVKLNLACRPLPKPSPGRGLIDGPPGSVTRILQGKFYGSERGSPQPAGINKKATIYKTVNRKKSLLRRYL